MIMIDEDVFIVEVEPMPYRQYVTIFRGQAFIAFSEEELLDKVKKWYEENVKDIKNLSTEIAIDFNKRYMPMIKRYDN